MDVSQLSRPLRLLLEHAPDAPSLETLLEKADSFVSGLNDAAERVSAIAALEDELQAIYDNVIDYASLSQAETLLALLFHLRSILPPTSVISAWFELALRPALREPKLPTLSVEHAKQLIVAALDTGPSADNDELHEKQKERVSGFRRRLMDLYLLDAYNESSGDDVLEWADLDAEQRDRKSCWKANLEDILVRFGLQRPEEFLTEIYHCFSQPSSRLQLLILLNTYTSQPNFPDVASVLATHRLMTSLLHSLLFDGSSTVTIVALTLLTKLLPIFAVKANEHLKHYLPLLVLILARMVCWREREQPFTPESAVSGTSDTEQEGDVELGLPEDLPMPPIHEDITWERLEQTFCGGALSAPSPHRYFTALYYLYPCNTIRFLRFPIQYMSSIGFKSPFAVEWDEVLDEAKIRSKSEPLMRGHILHPHLIWRGPEEELSQPDFWADYDIARIAGECTMLDVRNAALGMRQHAPPVVSPSADSLSTGPTQSSDPTSILSSSSQSSLQASALSPSIVRNEGASTPILTSLSGRLRVSLQDMIATSVALKSGLDIEIVHPSPSWSADIFPSSRGRSTSRKHENGASVGQGPIQSASSSSQDVHVTQALAGLQRAVLLLRNELNFELWNARENVKHIGRLYQDRVLSKTAEMERQGLHNRLREYKGQVASLQAELNKQKEVSKRMKDQLTDYNIQVQAKLENLRNEKKEWMAEAAAMRAVDKEVKETFAAQSRLLEEASHRVFQLETKIRENAPKVDRLHDYEKQIDQLVTLQRLWELDVQKLNDQGEYLQIFNSKYRKMELRLDTYEKTHDELTQLMRHQQQEVRSLENQLALTQRQLEAARNKITSLARLPTAGVEVKRVQEANQRLRDENSELHDEVEELRAMVEALKNRPIPQRTTPVLE